MTTSKQQYICFALWLPNKHGKILFRTDPIHGILGFLLNSVQYTVTVTIDKCRSLFKLVKTIQHNPHQPITIRFLARIIGKIVSFFPASNAAKRHYRVLECFKMKSVLLKCSWEGKIVLSPQCLMEIDWWVDNIFSDTLLTKSLLKPQPTQTIFTDSSGYGYGSVWNDKKFQGLFNEQQKQLSINTKELLAILYTLQVYASDLANEVVHIKTDNMVALYCL